jgi:hypothetical protein
MQLFLLKVAVAILCISGSHTHCVTTPCLRHMPLKLYSKDIKHTSSYTHIYSLYGVYANRRYTFRVSLLNISRCGYEHLNTQYGSLWLCCACVRSTHVHAYVCVCTSILSIYPRGYFTHMGLVDYSTRGDISVRLHAFTLAGGISYLHAFWDGFKSVIY